MSRDNFGIRLAGLDGSAEYVMVRHIARLKEVTATEKVPAHTVVYTADGTTVQVKETVAQIEQKGGAYGIFKILGN